jgi:hypothetical protein
MIYRSHFEKKLRFCTFIYMYIVLTLSYLLNAAITEKKSISSFEGKVGQTKLQYEEKVQIRLLSENIGTPALQD